jgi:hypothetical protein
MNDTLKETIIYSVICSALMLTGGSIGYNIGLQEGHKDGFGIAEALYFNIDLEKQNPELYKKFTTLRLYQR